MYNKGLAMFRVFVFMFVSPRSIVILFCYVCGLLLLSSFFFILLLLLVPCSCFSFLSRGYLIDFGREIEEISEVLNCFGCFYLNRLILFRRLMVVYFFLCN